MAPDIKETSELEATFRLTLVPGLGDVGIGRIALKFTSASAFWANPDAWESVRIPARLYESLENSRTQSVEKELEELERSKGWVLSIFDPGYPALLKKIHDPPPLLFGLGNPGVLNHESVAVVGSRRATPYGTEHAYRISRRLAEAGFNIISGLAVGVDAVAHNAALKAEGTSIAVLGSGIGKIYPPLHRELAAKLLIRGAIVSELRPFAAADRVNFPRRNRIISGLSRAVVIVEAREESGSLITAKQGLEQGREVFVVPGPAGGINRGGHQLLHDGAAWAEDAGDVIRVLRPSAPGIGIDGKAGNTPPREIPDHWAPIWNVMEPIPIHVDQVIERCGLRSSQVLGILLQMELQGFVRQQSGKMFLRS